LCRPDPFHYSKKRCHNFFPPYTFSIEISVIGKESEPTYPRQTKYIELPAETLNRRLHLIGLHSAHPEAMCNWLSRLRAVAKAPRSDDEYIDSGPLSADLVFGLKIEDGLRS
jgi:hypothetical protein